MKKQIFTAPHGAGPRSPQARIATKTPTTRAVVAKVQRVTADQDGGHQAPWVNRLQRTVDKRNGSHPVIPSKTPATERQPCAGPDEPAKDNRANQRNPNHEQYYKSRGLPGRPADWDKARLPKR